jgi:predicted metalloprotease
MWFLGVDPMTLLGAGGLGSSGTSIDVGAGFGDSQSAEPFRASAQEEELVDFVSFVLDDLQSTWSLLIPGYRDARLVLFRGATRSACGMGQREMGPFYCPGDQKVYIDLSFYQDLRARFGAPGDFAQAYVLAHEVGHHIQQITGLEQQVRREQRANPGRANQLSVRMELQADCLAGVWGHAAGRRGVLEPGDVEEGLAAAAAIGDDRIQRMSGKGVHPESFTHGSSAQRTRWLRRGLEHGDPAACQTFDD